MREKKKALTWHDEHVPVLLAVVAAMAAGTVADGEPRRLLADEQVLALVLVHLGDGVLE